MSIDQSNLNKLKDKIFRIQTNRKANQVINNKKMFYGKQLRVGRIPKF